MMNRLQRLILCKHHHINNAYRQHRRHRSAYAFGTQWTGALSRGPNHDDEAAELTPSELLAGDEAQNLAEMQLPPGSDYGNDGDGEKVTCLAGAAGWGHSAVIVSTNSSRTDRHINNSDNNNDNINNNKTRLLICGRPHDFQTLMRLRRLPSPLRRISLHAHTSNRSQQQQHAASPSFLQKMVSFLAGENEATVNEEECRRYSFVDRLMEVELPSGPALEGDVVSDAVVRCHGRLRCSSVNRVHRESENNTHPSNHDHHNHHGDDGNNIAIKPHNATFQNTLAASAGLTAVISDTGSLYTFGLNHRGQCGVGYFSPNVWTPSSVVGLASLRFILDYNDDIVANRRRANNGTTTTTTSTATINNKNKNNNNSRVTSTGSDVYKQCLVQEYPIVSVSLGLQHGIALDCMGQVFTWGKGERGQLGLGKRYLYEAYQDNNNRKIINANNDDNDAIIRQYKKEHKEYLDLEEPYENKTLEYAMQVTNFYDPYATISLEGEDVYAPLLSDADSKVRCVGAGMNFSVAVTESNLPYIWGKNCVHDPQYHNDNNVLRGVVKKPVLDSTYPRFVWGLPPNVPIVKVACGSHHASFLLQDGSVYAVGVATDQPVPMWNEAVEILPPNVADMPSLISFTAGFDRTFVVYGDSGSFASRQVIEIQLWSQEEMRLNGSVRPSWVDWLEDEQRGNEECSTRKKVKAVHRGWMHTVIITEV